MRMGNRPYLVTNIYQSYSLTGAGWIKVDKLAASSDCKFLGGKGAENLKSTWFFFDSNVWHVGSQFPDQGSNPCPLY